MHALRLDTSLSEYDLTPESTPLFVVGELWAMLHTLGFELTGLGRDGVVIISNGTPCLPPLASLGRGEFHSPELAARDLSQALSQFHPDDAQALLAGYVRRCCESPDPLQGPAFTTKILDGLGGAFRLPQMEADVLDVDGLLHELDLELRMDGRHVTLAISGPGRSGVWTDSPHKALLLVLGLLVAGLDCRALQARDYEQVPQRWRELLWPEPQPDFDPETEARRVAELAPGLEIAVGLCGVLRRVAGVEPYDFNDISHWVCTGLAKGSTEQAAQLGDALFQVSLRCARLAAERSTELGAVERHAQRAAIILQYACRGERSDELRLIALNRCLRRLPHYPVSFIFAASANHDPPITFDTSVAQISTLGLGLWNSILLVYRVLVEKSVEQQERGRRNALQSTALRGVYMARHVLPLMLTTTFSPNPDLSMAGFQLLRVTVKNYSTLLLSLWASAEHQFETGHAGGWLPFFREAPDPSCLTLEMEWISNFFRAACQDSFSRDIARDWVKQGRDFLPDLRLAR